MIDFHSHILPNVDDGAKSVEETFNLIQEAKNSGFEGIVTTPHYMEGYYEVKKAEIEVWVNALNEKLLAQNIDIKLYIANEVYLSDNIINLLETKKASTINNTNYVLFEMPLNAEPMNLYDIVYEMLGHKLIPILAHPERYTFVQKDPSLIYELIEKGVLMQANYTSILGRYGEKAELLVKKFLKNDMIHFLGSDVHRQKSIYTQIPKALKEIENIVGEEKLEELTTANPKLVLENKRIDIDSPKKMEFTLKEKWILKSK